eukprot:m.371249 g.371249  ORF g.371249 m.371249 type:complete len:88 (+) comp20864_c0_seq40:1665-1928(+)
MTNGNSTNLTVILWLHRRVDIQFSVGAVDPDMGIPDIRGRTYLSHEHMCMQQEQNRTIMYSPDSMAIAEVSSGFFLEDRIQGGGYPV